MPMLKEPKVKEPLWKDNDYKAQKKGIRNTVYSVNGDQYTGEWLNNLKDGKRMRLHDHAIDVCYTFFIHHYIICIEILMNLFKIYKHGKNLFVNNFTLTSSCKLCRYLQPLKLMHLNKNRRNVLCYSLKPVCLKITKFILELCIYIYVCCKEFYLLWCRSTFITAHTLQIGFLYCR